MHLLQASALGWGAWEEPGGVAQPHHLLNRNPEAGADLQSTNDEHRIPGRMDTCGKNWALLCIIYADHILLISQRLGARRYVATFRSDTRRQLCRRSTLTSFSGHPETPILTSHWGREEAKWFQHK